MSPRSLGRLVGTQHPSHSTPHSTAAPAAADLHGRAAAPGARPTVVTWAPAPAAGNAADRVQASPDRARTQSAAGRPPDLPLAAAAAALSVSAGGRHVSPAVSGCCSSAPPRAKCFKVPYQFSTPTEKRLQKQLEVSTAIECHNMPWCCALSAKSAQW